MIIQKETEEKLWDLVNEKLTRKERFVILEKVVEDKTPKEIAEEMGESAETIRKIQTAALRKLRCPEINYFKN